jgi:mono/diheme cytochrome c family protein/glucose/arabinose dehydrogenase
VFWTGGRWSVQDKGMARLLFLGVSVLLALGVPSSAAELIDPAQGASIAIVGGGQGERLLRHPHFEAELQRRFAGRDLVFRNLCDDGDTPGYRDHSGRNSPFAYPGAEKLYPLSKAKDFWGSGHAGVGFAQSPDEWLKGLKVDLILAWFGYAESFKGAAGVAAFRTDLEGWLDHTAQQKYNGKSAPQVVLLAPLALDERTAPQGVEAARTVNADLALYAKAIQEVATARHLVFVDLYAQSLEMYHASVAPLTRDGFVLRSEGQELLAAKLASIFVAGAPKVANAALAAAVQDKNWYWEKLFKIPNGVHVFGRRNKPFGPDNYPAEIDKLGELVTIRDRAVWAAAKGEKFDVAAADAKTSVLPPVKTNYSADNKKNGSTQYLKGEEAVKTLALPEGYKAELFASEESFPDLAKPVRIAFDNRGRLWVATMPSYPAWRPGDAKPDDKIIILEDTDGDGKADKQTIFARGLHLPLSFEFAPEGVYLSQSSHLELLRYTDGKMLANRQEVILSGFDDHDTHHAIHAFQSDPSGAFTMGEGTFLHSHVETAYGVERSTNGGWFRYSPQRRQLERTARLSIPNPWGMAFDAFGQDFFADTSDPNVRWLSPGTMKVPFGEFAPLPKNLVPKAQMVRPTAGLEFISSRHFPDDVQGDILINNTIGFLGTKQHAVSEDGTGFALTFRQNLLQSTDGNFRPVSMQFAPDGSLYVADWHNVLIGHMQHSARDPLRDHTHGRIYRITYPARPLVKPPVIAGASIDQLFANLTLPEDRARSRTRLELRGHEADEVLAGLQRWLGTLSAADPKVEHHQLEGLWVSWGLDRVDVPLLHKLLQAHDHRVRAAAVRVLRYNTAKVADHKALLLRSAGDVHGRVRMEAVNAASWLGKETALEVLAEARRHAVDDWLKPVYQAAEAYQNGGSIVAEEAPKAVTTLKGEEKKLFDLGAEVYRREAHCITCHQVDGQGLPAAQFPSIAKSPWVNGDPRRLVRIILHGLMGPIEVNGTQYPGQVPMTAFKGLSDREIAGVATYVRNAFGNKGSAVTPAQVAKEREATKAQEGFLVPAELQKQFPLGK